MPYVFRRYCRKEEEKIVPYSAWDYVILSSYYYYYYCLNGVHVQLLQEHRVHVILSSHNARRVLSPILPTRRLSQ